MTQLIKQYVGSAAFLLLSQALLINSLAPLPFVTYNFVPLNPFPQKMMLLSAALFFFSDPQKKYKEEDQRRRRKM
jgi:hypothetical protein